jgi:hypothetical protein
MWVSSVLSGLKGLIVDNLTILLGGLSAICLFFISMELFAKAFGWEE